MSTTTCPYCQRRQHRDEWDRRPKGMVTTDRTHGPDCWRDPGHHECAVARVERADLERDEALAAMSADTADVVLHFTSRATTAERALAELREAAELPMLFYQGGDPRDVLPRWREITGTDEMTTKVMCDTLRAALAAGGDDGN